MIKLKNKFPYVILLLSAGILILDQFTKYLALKNLTLFLPKIIFPFFNLTLLYNTGAAFSLLNNQSGWQRWLFTAIALIAIAAIFFSLKKINLLSTKISVGLILGGTLGNLWDRVQLGYVVDFIQLHYQTWYFPAFNLADSALSIGVFLFALEVLFKK